MRVAGVEHHLPLLDGSAGPSTWGWLEWSVSSSGDHYLYYQLVHLPPPLKEKRAFYMAFCYDPLKELSELKRGNNLDCTHCTLWTLCPGSWSSSILLLVPSAVANLLLYSKEDHQKKIKIFLFFDLTKLYITKNFKVFVAWISKHSFKFIFQLFWCSNFSTSI